MALYMLRIGKAYAFPGSMDAIVWNPNHSPIISHIRTLMGDYVHEINPEHWRYTGWHYITYGLAPCSYDLYIYCKFGIIPIVTLLVIDIFLAIKIMNNSVFAVAATVRGFVRKLKIA